MPPRRAGDSNVSSTLIDVFKITKDTAESLEKVPYVKSVAGILVQVLQIREEVKKNKQTANDLIETVRNRSQNLFNALARYADQDSKLDQPDLKKTLQPLETKLGQYQVLLEAVYASLQKLTPAMSGFLQTLRRSAVKEELEALQHRLAEFDMSFLVEQLVHMRLDVATLVANAAPIGPLPTRERVPVTPQPPSRLFTGRLIIRGAMKRSLVGEGDSTTTMGQKCYVLYGLGGSGKTQLALKFINEYGAEFTRIYMIDASSPERINTYLEDIGVEANISPSPNASDTIRWLAHLNENWLILFDNADDPTLDLHQFFPPCTHGKIIITTRNPECITHASPSNAFSHVSDLTLDDAIDLLSSSSRRSGQDDRKTIEALVRVLGFLALAIVQAGSFIAQSPGLSFASYLELYETNRARLLNQGPKQRLDSYTHTVYTTWDLSFERLTPAAQTFLQMCGFLHYEGIGVQIFKQAVLNFPTEPHQEAAADFLVSFLTDDGEWDLIGYLAITTELASYSLIQISQGILSIHPLVHSWSRDRLQQEEQNAFHSLALTLLSISITFEQKAADFAHRRFLLPHIEVAIPEPLSESEMHVDVAECFADACFVEQRWKRMEELCRFIVDKRMQSSGAQDPSTLRWKQRLAQALSHLRSYEEAVELEVDLVQEYKSVLGSEHPDTLVCMGNLAAMYIEQGRLDEAEALQLEVLQLRKKILGSEDIATLTSMANLASTYDAQGLYDKAAHLEVEVLEIRKRVLGSEHPMTMFSMSNLAMTYQAQGRYTDAERLHLEVLEARKRVLGSEYPDTLASMANLAKAYHMQGRHREAELIRVEVLELRQSVLGSEHPDTVTSMVDLAATYHAQRRDGEAESLQLEILDIRKRTLGSDHPDTVGSIANLAVTYFQQGRYSEAEPLQLESLEFRMRVLGSEHPNTLASMANLAWTYSTQRRYAEAEPLQRDLLSVYQRLRGAEHPDTLRGMDNLAATYRAQGRHTDAEALLLEVLETRTRVLGSEHPHTITSSVNLAFSYQDQGRYGEAEPLNVAGYQDLLRLLGPSHPDTMQSMRVLVRLYENQQRNEAAEVLRAAHAALLAPSDATTKS